MSSLAETLGMRIRRKRKERQFGLREMARALDISPTYLSRIETDAEHNPPAEGTLAAIARLLGDDVDELMHLAGRVPTDVSEMIKSDPDMPQFLRTARERGLSAKQLQKLMDRAKKR